MSVACVKAHMVVGNVPTKEFLAITNVLIADRLPIVGGMVPVRVLLVKFSDDNNATDPEVAMHRTNYQIYTSKCYGIQCSFLTNSRWNTSNQSIVAKIQSGKHRELVKRQGKAASEAKSS
jgi:hypothetical protein